MGHEGHEGHGHHEEKPLSFFASPLISKDYSPANHGHASETHSHSDNSLEAQKTVDAHGNEVPFQNMDCELHDSPAFHRHAEATTSELFYDLFFVANLTTFTSLLEINDHNALTAYIGFFSLLWLTWYQVSLYDVRFSADSIFERCAKAIHFGVMVGFAVIGAQWKPGQDAYDYSIFKAFGLILMVSRLTLFTQYGMTLFWTRSYRQTRLPLLAIMGSTLVAAVLYGALTGAFPKTAYDAAGDPIYTKSSVYIAWYVIALSETLLTVVVSCVWRVISFKGTHMVQRMSLLTLIILGEGIIVICKSISKIVKNDYLWTGAVIGQIVAAVLIIYLLYMLYFDRMTEEHFGSIRQQMWSFSHFPLHTVLVLVLQGVSLLIIWTQAVIALDGLATDVDLVVGWVNDLNYTSGAEFVSDWNATLYGHVFIVIPHGVDVSTEKEEVDNLMIDMAVQYDYVLASSNDTTAEFNETAADILFEEINDSFTVTIEALFETFSVSLPKAKAKELEKAKNTDYGPMLLAYVGVFSLVFQYVYISGGLSLIFISLLGFLSLPASKRTVSQYARLAITTAFGIGMALVSLLKYDDIKEINYMTSVAMIPVVMAVFFVCVLVNHVRIPGRHKSE